MFYLGMVILPVAVCGCLTLVNRLRFRGAPLAPRRVSLPPCQLPGRRKGPSTRRRLQLRLRLWSIRW